MQKTAQVILSALDCPEGELSILVVDDHLMETLNIKYLHRNGPTNVIAFPMRNGKFPNITPHLLGDIVLSVETAHKESKVARISIEKRLYQLLIHGILHLFGYDHEKSENDALLMEKKSDELFNLVENF
ncbi:MAG: rRNA maturation RNase YbeY [Desulfobacterales bacterium]|nr:rRNA maturation RNase YbeY [Desulfobacterales bacterium]